MPLEPRDEKRIRIPRPLDFQVVTSTGFQYHPPNGRPVIRNFEYHPHRRCSSLQFEVICQVLSALGEAFLGPEHRDGTTLPPNTESCQPRLFHGVTVSSTFTDLEQHRAALIKAIKGHGMTDVAMENDAAKPAIDLIDSSLQMVKDGAAYAGVISHKYGQIPPCKVRNPNNLSITELEFNEAIKHGRPILLFIMHDKHPLTKADIETDQEKTEKLNSFRERAKQMGSGSLVHRVYANFISLEDFATKAHQAVAELRRFLDRTAKPPSPQTASEPPRPADPARSAEKSDPIPRPPVLYAQPRYIGSHRFLGRNAQLAVLKDWAAAADPNPVLLFDAIGGTGKSMLTWAWTTQHASLDRNDWAGRFWYSFYEKGADMGDFCRRALAYMTETPLEKFRGMKTAVLREPLLHQLQAHRWLLVLDGLERVLVAYNRMDAADLRDEEVNQPTDLIAQRDPCAAIRTEDDDLLRELAGAAPSKFLITSRLVPRVLLNQAGQAIPGVRREPLPGLLADDAEALLRSCDVRGDSQEIQNYLKSNCDCHPLVIGALAGMIRNYLPDPGNFDAWVDDPDGGGKLNLAELDLVQRRNHILRAATDGLPDESHRLLSVMALLSEAVDYLTLSALSPFLPPEPEKIEEPDDPRKSTWWELLPEAAKDAELEEYETAHERWKTYEADLAAWRRAVGSIALARPLARAIGDLTRRGLLQYDPRARDYDLHPVVRGVAAGGLKAEEKDGYGQRVVDYFSAQAHNPYELAESLDDVRAGLHIVRTLLKMGKYQLATDAFLGALANSLHFNLEAPAEVLALLRPLFPYGWGVLPDTVKPDDAALLANEAGIALDNSAEPAESLLAYGAALGAWLPRKDWEGVSIGLRNIAITLHRMNRLAQEFRCLNFDLELVAFGEDKDILFMSRLFRFGHLVRSGQWDEAVSLWQILDPAGRNYPRSVYRPGDAEFSYAMCLFHQRRLSESDLIRAEDLAREGKNRTTLRSALMLRGDWRLDRGEWALAAETYGEALRMAREVAQQSQGLEARLALARLHLGQLAEARNEAERLARLKDPPDLSLSELWLALGEHALARERALAAFQWAWADGEPYVHRYELNKARAVLEKLGAAIPNLPPYDPAKDGKFPHEDDIRAAITQLQAEKAAPKREDK